jgi:hypothetical protein
MVSENFVLQPKAKPAISDGDTVSILPENPAERRGMTDNFKRKSDSYFLMKSSRKERHDGHTYILGMKCFRNC